MHCCNLLGQKLYNFCGTCLTCSIIIGTCSTAITTGLLKAEIINNWKIVALPSTLTFLVVVAYIIRCHANYQFSLNYQENNQSIIVNIPSSIEIPSTNKNSSNSLNNRTKEQEEIINSNQEILPIAIAVKV